MRSTPGRSAPTRPAPVLAAPALGLFGQVALLAALAATVGLTPRGWTVGLVCALVLDALLAWGLARSCAARVGVPNAVTLLRASLACGVAALVASGPVRAPALTVVVVLATVGLLLDAVDGRVARRTGAVTPLGARFDGEVDAFLILVLSVLVARSAGAWVLAIGLMRYAFLAAGVLRWMRRALPRRDWRKTVAAVQGIALTVAASDLLPAGWTRLLLVVALVLLVESFGRDVVWLWRQRTAARPLHRRAGVVHRVAGAAAVLLVWAVLVAPDRLSGLTPASLLRIPVEALVVVALAALVARRLRGPLAALVGLALTALVLVRVLDTGFRSTLDRPFDPLGDWQLLGPAVGVASDASGLPSLLLGGGAAVLALAVLGVLTASAVHLVRLAGRHRVQALRGVAVLGVVWALLAVTGVATGTGAPVASTSATQLFAAQVQSARTGLRDAQAFSRQLEAPDPVLAPAATTAGRTGSAARARAAPEPLAGLRGKDVLLVFVEAYGRVTVDGSAVSQAVAPALDAAERDLRAAGLSARSAFLTSPVLGGGSWLAHATLQSGLWVDRQARYDELLPSGRLTLTGAFGRAGWRTVLTIPSSPSPWPQGQALYGFDVMYGTRDLGYTGPAFSYAQVPDQYTLHALHERELARRPRAPVMAEVDLVSSHVPWAPLPRLVPWQALGTGDVFDPMPREGRRPAAVVGRPDRLRAAYADAVSYSLTALASYLRTFPDQDRVLVVLGDHQPTTDVTGPDPDHDVPVTVLARDPAVLDRIASWGWSDGLRPAPDAPVWRMDAFRDRFLAAFAGTAQPAAR